MATPPEPRHHSASKEMPAPLWDFIVIGSGFGGSVCSLRLVEKGYRVLLLEKGRRFGPADFATSNWQLGKWMWLPRLGWRGIFKMTFLRHVTVLSGVGVGGGSLVYANTLPVPEDEFFAASSWAHLADWKRELEPHYRTALHMLGATRNPHLTKADEVIRELGRDLGRDARFKSSQVAVYFGEPGVTVPDPYFGGQGPPRTGCTLCGACMIGCRHGAKNTLDRNYLYLAEKNGLVIEPDTEVTAVRPRSGGGYAIEAMQGTTLRRKRRGYAATQVIFSGGVLGTVPLLLAMSRAHLPRLSPRLGDFVRTNSEALLGVVTSRRVHDHSEGIAIGSILRTDAHSHLEPVRYPAGSGFFRILTAPHATGRNLLVRVAHALALVARNPLRFLRALFVDDWAKRTIILLYMRTIDGHLRLRRGRFGGLATSIADGPAPTANMREATDLARRVAEKVEGFPESLTTELLLGTPTTAHILGGCCMGDSSETGVIDNRHRIFGYEGLYVIDGSAVSANPGVNPALTITALAERAVSFIPAKADLV